MNAIVSPSALAIKAVGLERVGTLICNDEIAANHRCAVCGDTLKTGDPIDEMNLPDSFTNHSSLAIPGGKYRCGACAAVMGTSEFQMGLSTVLVSKDGCYPIMRKENRAWAFLNPPEAPFYITIQDSQQQHVAWRAPVTTSRDLILLRLGEKILRLRRPLLVRAREAAIRLHEARAALEAGSDGDQKNTKRGKGRPSSASDSYENPFTSDWKMQGVGSGALKSWVIDLIEQNRVADADMDCLLSLNAGEVLALTAILHFSPAMPVPITKLK